MNTSFSSRLVFITGTPDSARAEKVWKRNIKATELEAGDTLSGRKNVPHKDSFTSVLDNSRRSLDFIPHFFLPVSLCSPRLFTSADLLWRELRNLHSEMPLQRRYGAERYTENTARCDAELLALYHALLTPSNQVRNKT